MYENHSWRSPAHSEGPQTPKTCFWAWIRSLKPQKHPWMARWHSNSWIVSLNISRMQTGQDFRDIQLGFPGRPQVVFNRFTDSHPNPASRPQAPPDLVNFYYRRLLHIRNSCNQKFATFLSKSVNSLKYFVQLSPPSSGGIKHCGYLRWNGMNFLDALKMF